MIVRISGIVSEIDPHAVTIERDGVAHEILIPGYAVGELAASRGRTVTLHTLEFFEGSANTGHFVPRIVGFMHKEDRAFFNRFVGVKGFGPRKALKALSEPMTRIAGWITAGDTKALTSLPGIGARAASMIVAELRGKIDEFATGTVQVAVPAQVALSDSQQDALEVMVAWGDNRSEVERWMARSAQLHPDIGSAEEWVRACYKLKAGSEA